MANELPYFRFTVQAWQNGDISLESYEMKGFFIDVCGYYWIKDCSITLAMLQKKFRSDNMILELIDLGIIKHEKKHDKINIDYLNIQFDLLSEKRKRRQSAGSKGGNAKAKLKQKPSYKDKDKDKDKDNNKDKDKSIEDRKRVFLANLQPFLDDYGKDILNAFYNYWTEKNIAGKKMLFEMNKTFEISRRLKTWSNNESKFNNNGKQNNKTEQEQRHDALNSFIND